MNRIFQIGLTVLALAGTYGAISTASGSVSVAKSPTPEMRKTVIFADGSDPMPCFRRACTPTNDN